LIAAGHVVDLNHSLVQCALLIWRNVVPPSHLARRTSSSLISPPQLLFRHHRCFLPLSWTQNFRSTNFSRLCLILTCFNYHPILSIWSLMSPRSVHSVSFTIIINGLTNSRISITSAKRLVIANARSTWRPSQPQSIGHIYSKGHSNAHPQAYFQDHSKAHSKRHSGGRPEAKWEAYCRGLRV
jgi:hypothetical protein